MASFFYNSFTFIIRVYTVLLRQAFAFNLSVTVDLIIVKKIMGDKIYIHNIYLDKHFHKIMLKMFFLKIGLQKV